jgi:hypothetical protein
MSDKGMKKFIAIVFDVLFVLVIVFDVYLLTVNNFISINENILYAVIIILIPFGFYMTYMSFAKEIDWNKLPGDNGDEDDTEEASGDAKADDKLVEQQTAPVNSDVDKKL